MAGREQPYDPYIPAGGSGQGGSAGYDGGNTRTAAIQSVRANMLCGYDASGCATGWLFRSKCLASTLPTNPSYDGHSYSLVLWWLWECPYKFRDVESFPWQYQYQALALHHNKPRVTY